MNTLESYLLVNPSLGILGGSSRGKVSVNDTDLLLRRQYTASYPTEGNGA